MEVNEGERREGVEGDEVIEGWGRGGGSNVKEKGEGRKGWEGRGGGG